MAANRTILFSFAMICCVVIAPARANAQWWSRAPGDFEDCAESAQKTAASKEAKTTLLSGCETMFAGRRKPGGGYTYYDFMQNRHFDIAGPNPTPVEQKQIDEQYTAYLDRQRRSIIATAFLQKQKQQAEAASGNAMAGPGKLAIPVKLTAPAKAAAKPHVAVVIPRRRPKAANCADDFFTCNWSGFSARVKDFNKTLFGSSSRKAVRN